MWHDDQDEDVLNDPEGFKDKKCAFPGCKRRPVYVGINKDVYQIGEAFFCESKHALMYNNLLRIGSGVLHFTSDSLKPYNGYSYGVVEQFVIRAQSKTFQDTCLSTRLKLDTPKPYFLQYVRISDGEFIDKLTHSRWHLAPDLFHSGVGKALAPKTYRPRCVDRSRELSLYAPPLKFAQVLTEQLSELFSSEVYRPLPKDTDVDVLLSYRKRYRGSFVTHVVDMGEGHLKPWRYTRKEGPVYNTPLMIWQDIQQDNTCSRGLYYGKVTGEGRVVYEFLVFAGAAVTYRMDEETGMILDPDYDVAIQVYMNKLAAL